MKNILLALVILAVFSTCSKYKIQPDYDINKKIDRIEKANIMTHYYKYSIQPSENRKTILFYSPEESCKYEFAGFNIKRENSLIQIRGCNNYQTTKTCEALIKLCIELGIISIISDRHEDQMFIYTNTYVKNKFYLDELKKSYKYVLVYFYNPPDSIDLHPWRNKRAKLKKLNDKWYYYESTIDWKNKDVATRHPWFYLLWHH